MGLFDKRLRRIAEQSAQAALKGYFSLAGGRWPSGSLLGNDASELQLTSPYRQLPIVHAVVNAIANRVASVPMRYYRTGTDVEIDRHPVIDRLNKPGQELTLGGLLKVWMSHKYLSGQSLIEMSEEETGRVPSALTPIWYSEYDIEYDKAGAFVGFRLRKTRRMLPAERSLYDRIPSPFDPMVGITPLEAARISNETEWEARRYNKKFFMNDATPGMIYKTPDHLDEIQHARLRNALIDSREGVQNAHRATLLEGGLEAQALGVAQRDAQFVEQFGLTLHDVCAAFGVDPVIIGYEKESKFASAKEARRYFWTDVILPELFNVEHVLNSKLLARFNMEAHFDTEGIEALQENFSETVGNAVNFWRMGVPFNSINERLDLGFEPIPGGDEPGNSSLPLMLDYSPQSKDLLKLPEGPVVGEEAKQVKDFMIWKHARRDIDGLAADLRKKLKTFFYKAKQRVRSELVDIKRCKDITTAWQVIDSVLSTDKLAEIIITYLTRSGVIGWAQATGVSADFSRAPEEVLNIVGEQAGKIKQISENARDEVRKLLREAIDSGQTQDQLRDALMERLDHAIENLQSRAATIARTEVNGTYSQARAAGAKESGAVAKRWVAAPDARDSHLAAASEGVIGFDEDFSSVGMAYPYDQKGAPEDIINCRCLLVPIYEGEREAGGRTSD